MNFTVSIGELIGLGFAIVGAFWTLLKVSLSQFEKRLDERFKILDTAVGDVKRLELEIVRSDTRNAQTYMTQTSHEKALERIFDILERVEVKLDSKVDAAHCESRIAAHLEKQ